MKSGGADQLAEHRARIVEAEGLIEIGGDEEVRLVRMLGMGSCN